MHAVELIGERHNLIRRLDDLVALHAPARPIGLVRPAAFTVAASIGLVLTVIALIPAAAEFFTTDVGRADVRGVPEGAVSAGGRSAAPSAPHRPSDAAGSPVATREMLRLDFDDLRMTEAIAGDLTVVRGTPTQIAVAPQPTAVDRSLEFTVSSTGGGAEVCLGSVGSVRELTFDLRLSVPGTAGELRISGPEQAILQLALASDAATAGTPRRVGPLTAGVWYEARLDLNRANRTYILEVVPREGLDDTTSASGQLPAIAAVQAEVACIGVADGVPGAAVQINNVEVRS